MGRARGTKKNRGKPVRGAWPPELRDLQQRGGMAPDWHDAWHERGQGVQELLDEDAGSGNVVKIRNGHDVFISPRQEELVRNNTLKHEGYWGDLVSREGCQARAVTEEEAIVLIYDWLEVAASASREEHSDDDGEWLGDREDGVPVKHLLDFGLFDPFMDDQNNEMLESAPKAISDLYNFAGYDPPSVYEYETPEEVEGILDDLRPLYNQIKEPDEIRRQITKREIEERNSLNANKA